MLGLVIEGDALRMEERLLFDRCFFVAELPRQGLRRKAAAVRALRAMKKREIRRCVFPAEFPEREHFAKIGIAAVDTAPLLRRKAGEWTLIERQRRGLQGSVAVSAEQMTAELTRAVLLLLERVPYVLLRRRPGAEELQQALRRESGAVLRLGSESQLAGAETLLDFGASALEGRALTLRLGSRGKHPCFTLPGELLRALPPGLDHNQLAAALWELGRLRAEEIGMKSRM